ncbi:MAG: DUF350 domain-containing protein [Phycisphaerales bacterium]|nr:DUF350 domain-containing protein [Phycisphaerales bacterium]
MQTLIALSAAALAQVNPGDHFTASAKLLEPPTATELMLRGLLSAGLYGLLGIALMLVGFKLFDAITPNIDVQRELAENKNVALAIVVGAMLVGLALMLGRVISA